jgi:hypothetical protein
VAKLTRILIGIAVAGLAHEVGLAPAAAAADTPGASASAGTTAAAPATRHVGVVVPRLEWIREAGAESCISAPDLARLLARVLGEDAAPWALGDAMIEGLVTRGTAPSKWRARVRIVSSDGAIVGQRELTTPQPLRSATSNTS